MDVNFELYKIFYYAAETGNFSSAAAKLFISQSAVSQAVKNLEEKLGTTLFLRKSRSVHLTREGEMLFKHIEQAFNFIKTGESKLLEMQNMETGEIRIGVGDTICKYFLIPCLEKYILQHPRIKIQVFNRTTFQILNSLRSGSIDIGIVTLPVNDDSVLVEELISVEDIFVACNKFSELKGRKLSLQELSQYPLLMLEKNSATRRNTENFFKMHNIVISPELELESIDLLVDFARIGLVIAHVLKESANSLIVEGELFVVNTIDPLPTRNLGIATMKNVPLSKASSTFIGLLKNICSTF